MDANFKLKLKDRGLKDIELAPGWAYFVEEEAYQTVVKSLSDDSEVRMSAAYPIRLLMHSPLD